MCSISITPVTITLIVAGAFIFATLIVGLGLYVIGKYNLLITLRQKIQGYIRDLDLLLRIDLEHIRTRKTFEDPMYKTGDWFRILLKAESLAHEVTAATLNKNSLLRIQEAVDIVEAYRVECSKHINSCDEQINISSNALIDEKLAALIVQVREYNTVLCNVFTKSLGRFLGFPKINLPRSKEHLAIAAKVDEFE